jgi:hypothetical protein
MMIGVILSFAVGPEEVWCGEHLPLASKAVDDMYVNYLLASMYVKVFVFRTAACQAQGFLVYFGALAACFWTTFVAWQAANTGI